jgi:hypothetical protein
VSWVESKISSYVEIEMNAYMHGKQAARPSSIAEAALGFVRAAKSDSLRTHVWQATMLAVVSIVGAAITWVFIVWGPVLTPPLSQFAVFVLICFAILAVVALLAAVGPLGSTLAQHSLKSLDATLRRIEADEDLTSLETRVALVHHLLADTEASPTVDELRRRVRMALELLKTGSLNELQNDPSSLLQQVQREDPEIAAQVDLVVKHRSIAA